MLWWVILVLLVNRFRDRFDQQAMRCDEPDRRHRHRRLRRCDISDRPQARTLTDEKENAWHAHWYLIHGYSAEGKDFENLKQALVSRGIDSKDIDICNYVSLNNEVTIKDIAEGLDRAFRMHQVFGNETQEFDAIVHSTGMLVLRAWLANAGRSGDQSAAQAPQAPDRPGAGHLGFAAGAQRPHLAGRHGERQSPARPRFPERRRSRAGRPRTGQQIHLGPGASRPARSGALLRQGPQHALTSRSSSAIHPTTALASVANDPGTDGTVRWSGCSLNARKITIDLTRVPVANASRLSITPWASDRLDIPMIAGGRAQSRHADQRSRTRHGGSGGGLPQGGRPGRRDARRLAGASPEVRRGGPAEDEDQSGRGRRRPGRRRQEVLRPHFRPQRRRGAGRLAAVRGLRQR